MTPNIVYTDSGVRITIDIDDAENVALISYHSATWNFGCQYNNSNMPDAFSISPYGAKASLTTAYGMNGRPATPGREATVRFGQYRKLSHAEKHSV